MQDQFKRQLKALEKETEERLELTENNNLPLSIYSRLATDESSDVRYALASNANIPLMVLYVLTEDENVFVSQRARNTIDRIEKETIRSNMSIIHYGSASIGSNQGLISA